MTDLNQCSINNNLQQENNELRQTTTIIINNILNIMLFKMPLFFNINNIIKGRHTKIIDFIIFVLSKYCSL